MSPWEQIPIISIEDGMAEDDWEASDVEPSALVKKFRSWATTLCHQHRAPEEGHQLGSSKRGKSCFKTSDDADIGSLYREPFWSYSRCKARGLDAGGQPSASDDIK